MIEEMNKTTEKNIMISCFKYAFKNVPHLKRFHACFSNQKNSIVWSAFHSPWKIKFLTDQKSILKRF